MEFLKQVISFLRDLLVSSAEVFGSVVSAIVDFIFLCGAFCFVAHSVASMASTSRLDDVEYRKVLEERERLERRIDELQRLIHEEECGADGIDCVG